MMILVSILLFLQFCITFSQQSLFLRKVLYGSLKAQSNITYNLQFNQPLKTNTYLFVVANPYSLNIYQTPQLTVINGNKMWKCQQNKHIELCAIASSQIDNTLSLQIQASCIVDCNYNLLAYADQQYSLSVGQQIIMIIRQNVQGYLININIPYNLNFSEIVIAAQVLNIENAYQGFFMHAVVNSKLNFSFPFKRDQYNHQGMRIWNGGMGMIFNKSDINNGDNISMILIGPNKTKFLIKCYSTNENVRNISSLDNIKQFMKGSEQKIYILNLENILSFNNQILEINIIRFSGDYNAIISNSSKFEHLSQQRIYTSFNIDRFLYKIQNLRQHFTQNLLFIKIVSLTQCAFQIKIKQISNYNFTFIKHNQLSFSRISNNQVNNYLYIAQYEAIQSLQLDPLILYTVYVQQFEGMFNLFIRRCSTLQYNNSINCIFNQFEQLFGLVRSQEIYSHYHTNGKFKQINFQYDITKCPLHGKKYRCVFQFVVWSMRRNSQLQYSLSVEEQGKDIQLKEGQTKKIKLEKNQTKYLHFTLGSLIDVQEIKFYLNTIYGDCALVSSNTKYHPSLYDDDQSYQILISEGNIKYNRNQSAIFSKDYFLSLYGYEQSSITLSLQVIRPNNTQMMIEILQNIFYTFSLEKKGHQNRRLFYIKLDQPDDFYISISNHDTYSLNITLYPYQIYTGIKNSTYWKPTYDIIQVNNLNNTYSRNNQFVLIVENKFNLTSRFSLMYGTESSCILFRVGQIIQIGLNQKTMKCIFFTITKPEDFEVIITQNLFQLVNNRIEIYSFISGTQIFFAKNIIKLSANQLKNYCKSFDPIHPSNVHDCNLKVLFKSDSLNKISILSQYTNSQVQLINGIQHRVEQSLNRNKPKYLYSKINSEDTLKINIKRSGSQKYKINAKIMQENKFALLSTSDAYLKNDSQIFESQTDSLGVTMLLIKSKDIQNINCKKCILLISVFFQQTSANQLANFTIQVSQQAQQIKLGDVSFHFIQKDTSFSYIYKPLRKTLISLNSMVSNCAQFDIYKLEQSYQFRLVQSNKTQILLEVNGTVQTYGIVIYGIQSCHYQLLITQPLFNFIELTDSKFYQGIINPNQSIYFIYYHHEDTNLQFVSFQDYGEVFLSAAQFDSTYMTNQTVLRYQYQSESYKGRISIKRNSNYFCYQCFYLIRVTSAITSKFTLVTKIGNLAIPLREDRILRDQIQNSETITYAYRSESQFRLQITNLYGDFNIILKNNEQIFEKIIYKNIFIYEIPGSGKDINDKACQYLITIIGFKSSAYLISLRKNSNLLKLKYNNPSSLVLKQNKQSCGKFIAQANQSSIYILIESEKLMKININFDCTFIGIDKNTCKINLKQNHSNLKNINYQFAPQQDLTEYTICAISKQIQTDISILISTNNINQLAPISEYLFKSSQNSTISYFSINNNKNNSYLFIQIYQCQGKINLTASKSLQALRTNEGDLIVNEVQSSGHHIISMPNISEGQYFLKTQSQKNSLYILKYNFYQLDNPYEKLTSGNKGNTLIDINNDRIIFSFKQVKIQSKWINKIQYKDYYLNIAKTKQQLLTYTQCNIDNQDPIYTKILKSTNLNQNQITKFNNIKKNTEDILQDLKFQVKTKQLSTFFGKQTKLLFIQITCVIGYSPLNHYKSDYYKINYAINMINIPMMQNEIKPVQSKFKSAMFWIILPIIIGTISLIYAIFFCIRKIRQLRYQSNFVQQQNQKKPQENVSNTDTNQSNKVIITKQQKKLQQIEHIPS